MNDIIYDIVKKIYEVLDDKKGQSITVLSVKGISPISDYFVIATATSSTHMNALVNHVEKELSNLGIYPRHKEGKDHGGWLLIDYRDVVIHIFNAETRQYYALERIWSDATPINFSLKHVKNVEFSS